MDEIRYRDKVITKEDVLLDAIESAACIVGKGFYNADEFPMFLKGIQAISGHVLVPPYHLAVTTEQACRVMYAACCIYTGKTFTRITDPASYLTRNISGKYKKLAYMKR